MSVTKSPAFVLIGLALTIGAVAFVLVNLDKIIPGLKKTPKK